MERPAFQGAAPGRPDARSSLRWNARGFQRYRGAVTGRTSTTLGLRLARRPAVLLIAVLAGLAIGWGIAVLGAGGLEAWLNGRGPAGFAPPYDPRGRTVQVDGRDLYLDCRGTGSPTVILEAGLGSGAASWGTLFDDIATTTRTCAWDRPGLGRSEGRGLHTGLEAVADLRAALGAAEERGPFVVVAHSLGGVYAQLFAAHPAADGTEVAAFVMIDTYEPLLGVAVDPAVPVDVRAMVQESLDGTGAAIQQGEDLDWDATMVELERLGPVRLPAVLLFTEPRLRYGDPSDPQAAALIAAFHRGVARRYPTGDLRIVPNAGHFIHLERPALVAEAIREIVLALRVSGGS